MSKRRQFAMTWVAASIVVGSLFCSVALAADEASARLLSETVANVENARWCLRLPQGEHVTYQGVVSFDNAGAGTGSIVYPAPNVGGLIAAIITHGLLVESTKKGQKDRLRATADEVLAPYKSILDKFTHRDLMRRAADKAPAGTDAQLVEESSDTGSQRVVESAPVFSLTQDQTAIILDNAIAIHMPGAATTSYKNTIRVISAAMDQADPVAFWTANDGEKLKDESAKLVAESLEIALRDTAVTAMPDTIAYRTIRYREGAAEKIERAQILGAQCDRLLIRNLRGTLMSVPASGPATVTSAAELCEPGAIRQN